MIKTGLSESVAGHDLYLERDEINRIAWVVVEPPSDREVTEMQKEAVRVRAQLLYERAKRFLGIEWTIYPWIEESKVKTIDVMEILLVAK